MGMHNWVPSELDLLLMRSHENKQPCEKKKNKDEEVCDKSQDSRNQFVEKLLRSILHKTNEKCSFPNDQGEAQMFSAIMYPLFGASSISDLKEENWVASLASAEIVLAMACLGAGGNTKRQMMKCLKTPNGETIESYHKSVTEQLKELDNPEFESEFINACSIFLQKGTGISQNYEQSLKTTFDSEVQSFDFVNDNDAAIRGINEWVDTNTKGKYPNLLQGISEATRMMIFNVIYLKAKWLVPFHIADTRRANFHCPNGVDKEVDFMNLRLDGVDNKNVDGLKVIRREGYRILELPYKGGRLSMHLLLQDKECGNPEIDKPEQVEKDFAAFISSGKRFEEEEELARYVHVMLPKFKIESSHDLTPMFEDAGMSDMFSYNADFTRMFTSGTGYVSKAVQVATVDVTEDGTEACAVTYMCMKACCIEPEGEPMEEFIFDRPFWFVISDKQTDRSLFNGKCVDPSPI